MRVGDLSATDVREGLSTRHQVLLVAGIIAVVSPALLILLRLDILIGLAWVGVLAALGFIVAPRIGFPVFVVALGLGYEFYVGPMAVRAADIVLLLLALGALLEFFLRDCHEIRRTPFDLPYAALAAATLLSVPLAHDRTLCITPIVRLVTMYLTFRLTFKYAGEIGVGKVVRLYLLVVFVLSVMNGCSFIASGGTERVFGAAWLAFENLSMTALPMAAAMLVMSTGWRSRLIWLVVCTTIGIAVLGTQSRAPLVAILLTLPLLAWFAVRRLRRPHSGRKTMVLPAVLAVLVCLVAIAVAFRETLFADVFDRMQQLLNSLVRAEGTVALRLVLWTAAIQAFLSNPITGIGIGNFRVVDQIFPDIHMVPVWYYIGGMSAHNVVLHYLAETGLPGALALLWLVFRGFKWGRLAFWRNHSRAQMQVGLALLAAMTVLVTTVFFTRSWTWGLESYIMAFLFGLTAAWVRVSQADEP